jgi:hypothetical protein
MPNKLIDVHKWILLARSMAPVWGHAYKKALRISKIKHIRKKSSLHSFLPPFLLTILLWCSAASSLSVLLLAMHEEKGEQDP